MSPGSLGLRTASYGSLQQQLQNGLLPSQLPPPVLPFVARKPAKMLKEKERLFHWIFKFVGRKKMGMMFLCIVSAAVFMWVLYVGKGEASIRIHNVTAMNYESSPSYFERSSISKYFAGYTLLPGNPCEKFTLPPPPADKKRTGPRPCPVCYLSVEAAIALMPSAPSYSPVHSLTYVHEEYLSKTEFGGSKFGGYPSLKQREDSYHIQKLMTVHCGFVKGSKPGLGTGFDIDDTDLLDMEQCRGIVVASAIFGYYDLIHQPTNISEVSKKDVCFFMFLDEETEAAMRNTLVLDGNKKVGLWRIVIVHNLPYTDPRRNGKVPKLLLHRLFPNTHYSIWMDGKLELVVDPYQILERFLWRQNATFAISRHYRRFNVFVEAEANKAAAKYDNSSIDFQIEFYKKEGLTPYSIAKLPIASDVPEGCVIIREHVPISNLFGCLWFNEVDRFTSRDQISFSTVRDKIRKRTNWTVSMFLDCERRNFVVQAYHRDVISQKLAALSAIPSLLLPPPPPQTPAILAEKPPSRRVPSGRGKGRRRNRKVSRELLTTNWV